jgi:hypothetical protein
MADEPLEEGETLETEIETPEGEPAPEQEAAPAAEGEAEEPKREPWFTKRIGILTAERQSERQAKEQLARENEALKALLNGKMPATETPAEPVRETAAPVAQSDFDKAVAARAAAIAAQATFDAQCNTVASKGAEAFPGKFDAAVANLNAAGVMTNPFLEAAFSTDAPEQVLFKLGNEPEEAMRLASMSPTQMAVTMDRMARELTVKTPAKTSDAPNPITPVSGVRTTKPFDAADKEVPYATWIKEREKQVAARRANR